MLCTQGKGCHLFRCHGKVFEKFDCKFCIVVDNPSDTIRVKELLRNLYKRIDKYRNNKYNKPVRTFVIPLFYILECEIL